MKYNIYQYTVSVHSDDWQLGHDQSKYYNDNLKYIFI